MKTETLIFRYRFSVIKRALVSFFFIVLAFMTFTNCQKKDKNLFTDEENGYTYLLNQGYDTTGVVDLGDYYLVEGDILIKKSSLSTMPRQAYHSNSNLVALANQQNITVKIDGSVPSDGGSFDWRDEIEEAISVYNYVYGTNISMQLITSGTADITIEANATLPSSTLAAAGPPSGGQPFDKVIINTAYTWHSPVLSGQKLFTIIHELGHCIGFRHTNWNGLGESAPNRIGVSPNSGTNPDPSSVMNGGNTTNSWSGFSTWDKYAIKRLYPLPPISVNVNNTSTSGFIAGSISFYNDVSESMGTASLANAQSSSQVSLSPDTYNIKAFLAPGQAPIYVSVNGATPVLVNTFVGVDLGSHYISSGFYVDGYR